jgi:NodT family efflux transporter outer membrane factor (OMF) lipoprotein
MKYSLIILIVLSVGLHSCKAPTIATNSNSLPNMPLSFNNGKAASVNDSLIWVKLSADSILNAYIESAIKNNTNILLAYQKIELARSQQLFTRGNLRPQVNIGGSSSLRKFGLYTMDGAGNIVTEITPGKFVPIALPDYYVGVQGSWEIDFRKKLSNLDKSALAKILSSQEGLKYVTGSLAADVALSYYELLALDNELLVIKESALKEKEALDYMKAQKEAGKVNELVVQQFTAQYYNLQILEKEVLQLIAKEENRLNLLLGRYPQPIERKKENLFVTNYLIPTTFRSDVLLNRPDIKAAEWLLESAKFDVLAARAAFYPSFSINMGLGFQAFNLAYFFTTPQSIAYQLVGNFFQPILNRSAIQSQFNYAKANQLDALYQYQQSLLTAFMEVSNEIKEYENLENIKMLTELKLNEYKKASESSLDLYKAARITYLDVLLSQQNALQTNIELIKLHNRKQSSYIKLFKNLGGNWK